MSALGESRHAAAGEESPFDPKRSSRAFDLWSIGNQLHLLPATECQVADDKKAGKRNACEDRTCDERSGGTIGIPQCASNDACNEHRNSGSEVEHTECRTS